MLSLRVPGRHFDHVGVAHAGRPSCRSINRVESSRIVILNLWAVVVVVDNSTGMLVCILWLSWRWAAGVASYMYLPRSNMWTGASYLIILVRKHKEFKTPKASPAPGRRHRVVLPEWMTNNERTPLTHASGALRLDQFAHRHHQQSLMSQASFHINPTRLRPGLIPRTNPSSHAIVCVEMACDSELAKTRT
jgi:hypothetical protein